MHNSPPLDPDYSEEICRLLLDYRRALDRLARNSPPGEARVLACKLLLLDQCLAFLQEQPPPPDSNRLMQIN